MTFRSQKKYKNINDKFSIPILDLICYSYKLFGFALQQQELSKKVQHKNSHQDSCFLYKQGRLVKYHKPAPGYTRD